MGCGWCGGMCGRQKECPGSWQQDYCPPVLTEVWLACQGTVKGWDLLGLGWESAGLNHDLPQIWYVLSSYKEGTHIQRL